MAHFTSYHKKSPLTKQWLSLLITVIISWCTISNRVWRITLSCWQIWQSFRRKLNTKLIMSAARHPQVDSLLERVNETLQITLRCYSSWSIFWLGISFTQDWFLLQSFNHWEFDTFKVSYEYLPNDLLIDYGQWLMHRLSLPTTCLNWQVFAMFFESY